MARRTHKLDGKVKLALGGFSRIPRNFFARKILLTESFTLAIVMFTPTTPGPLRTSAKEVKGLAAKSGWVGWEQTH